MTRKAGRMAGFRPTNEIFKGIRWRRSNRIWHETYTRTDPRFPDACWLDWSAILKRPDVRHTDGRQLALVSRRFGGARVVYFVVYVKRNLYLNVISIRYADVEEKHLFLAHYS
jgi:uncharacterized DUF497 family protein